ncbi:hypothetical protein DFH27DRAFT_86489 [Peziza echinospora]|nr:hypothetical protein DFH27DRAFT_86489 [Peziza echinospora]
MASGRDTFDKERGLGHRPEILALQLRIGVGDLRRAEKNKREGGLQRCVRRPPYSGLPQGQGRHRLPRGRLQLVQQERGARVLRCAEHVSLPGAAQLTYRRACARYVRACVRASVRAQGPHSGHCTCLRRAAFGQPVGQPVGRPAGRQADERETNTVASRQRHGQNNKPPIPLSLAILSTFYVFFWRLRGRHHCVPSWLMPAERSNVRCSRAQRRWRGGTPAETGRGEDTAGGGTGAEAHDGGPRRMRAAEPKTTAEHSSEGAHWAAGAVKGGVVPAFGSLDPLAVDAHLPLRNHSAIDRHY